MQPIKTLIGKINEQIIAPIILLLFVLALAIFFWGVVEYIRGSDDEKIREIGRDHMIWGIIGIFIMVSSWTIIIIILGSMGASSTPTLPSGLFGG